MKYIAKQNEVDVLLWNGNNTEEIKQELERLGYNYIGVKTSGAGTSIDFERDGQLSNGRKYYGSLFTNIYMLFQEGQLPKMISSRDLNNFYQLKEK